MKLPKLAPLIICFHPILVFLQHIIPLQHIHELPHKFMKDSYNLCTILSINSNQNCPSLSLLAMISTLYYSWHTLHQLSIHHWYFILSHHLGQTSLLEGFNLLNDHGWTWSSFSQVSSRILSIQTTQKHEMLWNWVRVGSLWKKWNVFDACYNYHE